MEMQDNDTLEDLDTSLDGVQSLSLLKEAQRRRQERERTLFLDVPSWDGDMICEYRVVPPEELRRIAERTMRRVRNGHGDSGSTNDIDIIIAASVGLYMRDPDTGERVAIDDKYGHVGYDRIAVMLGKDDEIQSNADAVRYLMSERDEDGGWVENTMAISLHANAIGRWMRDPSKRGVDLDDILGEL
jgi:hypothetical protein